MTIPADVTKVNFDASGDDPRAARAEFVTWADATNTLLAHVRAAPYVANSYTVGEGTEVSGGAVRAKVRAAWGIGRDGNGLALDVNGLATIAADVDPAADLIPIYDASGSVIAKVIPSNLLKAYKDLTQLTSVDGAADKVPVYDASAAALKWALPSALSGGAIMHGGTVDTGTAAASQQVAGLQALSARHLIFWGGISPTSDGQTLSIKLLASGGGECANVTTAAGTNAGADIGYRFVGFAPYILDGTNKTLFVIYWSNAGSGLLVDRGASTSIVDQVQVVASAGNVSGNLQVYYTI